MGDKAELHSHELMTVAKQALSHTTQTVLMALDENDSNAKLEEIVGKDAMPNMNTELENSDLSLSENRQLAMEIDDSRDNSGLEEENLIDSHAAKLTKAAEDTIF